MSDAWTPTTSWQLRTWPPEATAFSPSSRSPSSIATLPTMACGSPGARRRKRERERERERERNKIMQKIWHGARSASRQPQMLTTLPQSSSTTGPAIGGGLRASPTTGPAAGEEARGPSTDGGWEPKRSASCRASTPRSLRAEGSAPASSNACTSAWLSNMTAIISGVAPTAWYPTLESRWSRPMRHGRLIAARSTQRKLPSRGRTRSSRSARAWIRTRATSAPPAKAPV
mmetsp:Transcript_79336/g.222478  ORF Transcript_79336/g.222478 Transcript_79336/m.222478 type:complete len:230 (+) Transcript_79336:921-1610(+)